MSILISFIIALIVLAVVFKILPLLGFGEPWNDIIKFVAGAALLIWLLKHLL